MSLLVVQSDAVRDFAHEYAIELDPGPTQSATLTPRLMPLDSHGRPLLHITDTIGADFYLTRIDYFDAQQRLQASRAVAMVMPGYRTKSAYWHRSGNRKVLTVHKGSGYLILGDPIVNDDDLDNFHTTMFTLDPSVTPQIVIPPGRFYAIEAASWHHEPLVLSGVSKPDVRGTWEEPEVVIEPGAVFIETVDGSIEVPEEFYSGNFS